MDPVILDAQSVKELFRLDGIDFINMEFEQLTGVICMVSSQQSDAELGQYLEDIKKSTGG